MNQAIRERINACADVGADQFRKSVRPIYGVNPRGIPELIGSGVLFDIGGKRYVITAAHVIDEAQQWGFQLGVGNKLVPINGEFTLTEAPYGNRDLDSWDFAWHRLSNTIADSGDFISEQRIARVDNGKHRLYLMLGYPGSQNKVNPTSNRIAPKLARYTDTEKHVPLLCKELHISGDHHLFIGFDSKWSVRSRTGEKTRTFKPHGLSGGALLDMGDMSRIDNLASSAPCDAKLAGFLLSNHPEHKAICAVSARFVVDRILESRL